VDSVLAQALPASSDQGSSKEETSPGQVTLEDHGPILTAYESVGGVVIGGRLIMAVRLADAEFAVNPGTNSPRSTRATLSGQFRPTVRSRSRRLDCFFWQYACLHSPISVVCQGRNESQARRQIASVSRGT